MADKKKSIIEEAIAEFNLIEETLNSNAKEILRSVAKEEITSTLNESLFEDEDEYDIEDIEDIEDVDSDVDALPVDDAPEGGSEELGLDSIGVDAGEEDLGLEPEEGSEDYGLDMTSAPDEEVISVFKKLQGDDEIEVVSSNEVIIKDPVSGSEYNVKMNAGGGESLIDQGELDVDDFEAETEIEPEAEIGAELGGEEADEEGIESFEAGEDAGDDSFEAGDDESGEDEVEIETGDDEEDEDLGEAVVYEIELSEDDEIAEDIVRGKGHDKELVNTTAPNSGDIEGQTAPEDKDSGDNLDGGFDEKGQNGSGDNHAKHIMEDEAIEETEEIAEGEETIDESEDVIDEEEVVEGEEAIDEKISTNRVRTNQAGGDLTDITGPGGKLGRKDESVSKKKLVETVKKYNTLLSEAKAIKAENETFKKALKDFRKTITETAVFNINLTHATKLFLEHSTTSEEKKNILTRFDEEVTTIEESKKLYKRINSELGNKIPMNESVENKLMSEQTSGQSSQINETVAYVDPAQKRVLDLINRTK